MEQQELLFQVSTTPENAYVPEEELWLELFKVGKWTPSDGKEIDWTEDKVVDLYNNTVEKIKNNYSIPVNIDHLHEAVVYGMFDAVKYNKKKQCILGRVKYFTYDLQYMLTQGKLPDRSVEIQNDTEGKLYISAVAMVSYPAVKSLEPNPASFKEEQSVALYFSSIPNTDIKINKSSEVIMNNKTTEVNPDVKDKPTVETKPTLEFKELQAKIAQQELLMNQLKEIADKNKIEFEKERETNRRLQFKEFAEKNKIPSVKTDDMVELLFSIEKGNSGVLTFSENKQGTALDKVKELIVAFSATFEKLRHPEINRAEISDKHAMFSESVNNDNAAFAAKVSAYAQENNLDFVAAYKKMDELGLIL